MQVPERITRRMFVGGFVTVWAAGAAGCLGDDDGDDGGNPNLEVADDYFDDIGIYILQLLDRSHEPPEEISYMHDDHWDAAGEFPTVAEGDHLSLEATAYTEDEEELELWDEYELHVDVAPQGDEDLVSFESHGDHVYIHGEAEGVTEIVFLLAENGEVAYQSGSIAVMVGSDNGEAGDFDPHHVSDVSILDRAHDPHEEVAQWHDDHWDGELPTVPIDDTISLGATFVDEDGNEAELSDAYELRTALAEGADEIVSFDYHGDHVHIIGDEAGTTEVVFELWHDDHVDFETTPIAVAVED